MSMSLGSGLGLTAMRGGVGGGGGPEYVGTINREIEWQQGDAATLTLADKFSGADSYSISRGALPPGMALSGSTISGTPTGFQGRRNLTIRATNELGFVERRILLSVRPSLLGAFGTAYVSVVEEITYNSIATIQNLANVLVRACTFNAPLIIRNVQNLLIVDSDIRHLADEDGIRFSNTGAGCDEAVLYNNHILGIRKDGINLSGDWDFHGPDIHILNNLIEYSGVAEGSKKHGMYLHSMCHVGGNIVTNSDHGNAISIRSSANVECNFIDGVEGGGVSYFADHPASGSFPVNIRENIVVDAGTGENDGDIILRDVPTPANRVAVFNVTDNILTTTTQDLVEVGTGYAGATITQSGQTLLTATAARALFPTYTPTAFAPTVSGSLGDVTYIQETGVQTVAAASVFAGSVISYAVTGTGATINAATGVVSITTADLRTGSIVSVTATGPGGTSPAAAFEVTVQQATITIDPAVSNAGIGTVFVGESHASVLGRMTTPPGTDVANAPEGSTSGAGTVSRTVTVTTGANPFAAGPWGITVQHAASGAANVQAVLSGTVIAATITAAGADAPSTAGIATILDGATIAQILAAMTDLGSPSTNGVGSVTTARSVTVNGTAQTGSTAVSTDDAVRVIVTYSATGAPDLVLTLGPVTVTASTVWSITPGDGQATVNSFPAFSGTWSITPGDGEATVNTSPGVV